VVLFGTGPAAVICEGLEEELQRGEPLLTVDDKPGFEAAGLLGLLFEDDCTEKVGPRRLVGKKPAGDGFDVVPQRLPLLLFLPHAGPLVKRHDMPAVLAEDRLEVERASVHDLKCL